VTRIALCLAAGALALQGAIAQEAFTMRYRLAGDHVYRFHDTAAVTTDRRIGVTMAKSLYTTGGTLRVATTEVGADGSTVMTVFAEAVHASLRSHDTTITPTFTYTRGSRVRLSKLGEILSWEAINNANPPAVIQGMERVDMLRLHTFPAAPVRIGGKWRSVLRDTVDRGGGGRSVEVTVFQSTLQGRESRAGHDCLKVSFTGTTTVTGKWSDTTMAYSMTGSGKSSGTYLVDIATGLPVAEDARDDNKNTLTVTGARAMEIHTSSSTVRRRTLTED